MSNQQIIDAISGSSSICGRLEHWQLNSINHQLAHVQKSWQTWKRLGLAAFMFFVVSDASAQTSYKVKPKVTHHFKRKKAKITYKNITGVVIDSRNQLPMKGVTVSAIRNTITAVTDSTGFYTISIPQNIDSLKIEYPGYLIKHLTITKADNCADVSLQEREPVGIIGYGVRKVTTVVGALTVVISNPPPKRPSFFKRMYQQLIQKPARKIFG